MKKLIVILTVIVLAVMFSYVGIKRVENHQLSNEFYLEGVDY